MNTSAHTAPRAAGNGFVAGMIGLAGGLVAALGFMAVDIWLPVPWVASLAAAAIVTGTNFARVAFTRVLTPPHYVGTVLIVCAAVTEEGGVPFFGLFYVAGLVYFSMTSAHGNMIPERDGRVE